MSKCAVKTQAFFKQTNTSNWKEKMETWLLTTENCNFPDSSFHVDPRLSKDHFGLFLIASVQIQEPTLVVKLAVCQQERKIAQHGIFGGLPPPMIMSLTSHPGSFLIHMANRLSLSLSLSMPLTQVLKPGLEICSARSFLSQSGQNWTEIQANLVPPSC